MCPLSPQNQHFPLWNCFFSSPILLSGHIKDLWQYLPQFLQFPLECFVYSTNPPLYCILLSSSQTCFMMCSYLLPNVSWTDSSAYEHRSWRKPISVPYLRGPRRPSAFIISVKNSSFAFIFQVFEYPSKIDDQIFEHLPLTNMLAWVIRVVLN